MHRGLDKFTSRPLERFVNRRDEIFLERRQQITDFSCYDLEHGRECSRLLKYLFGASSLEFLRNIVSETFQTQLTLHYIYHKNKIYIHSIVLLITLRWQRNDKIIAHLLNLVEKWSNNIVTTSNSKAITMKKRIWIIRVSRGKILQLHSHKGNRLLVSSRETSSKMKSNEVE